MPRSDRYKRLSESNSAGPVEAVADVRPERHVDLGEELSDASRVGQKQLRVRGTLGGREGSNAVGPDVDRVGQAFDAHRFESEEPERACELTGRIGAAPLV